MKKIFGRNILLFFLVSCSIDSKPEYSDLPSNSEILNTQSLIDSEKLRLDSNSERFYILHYFYFVPKSFFSYGSKRKDRDWEKAITC